MAMPPRARPFRSVLSDNRRVPDRADVLGAHRAAGVGEQAPRACELAEMRAVRADREQLVAVGIRPEGIAGRIEYERPRRRLQAVWQDAASRGGDVHAYERGELRCGRGSEVAEG